MVRLPISTATAGILRALISRSRVERNRILLSEVTSTDWQSLTFTGERHQLRLTISGPDAHEVAARICDGLEDAELQVSRAIVADIAIVGGIVPLPGDAVELTIEALTVADD